jgi:hypothetical protein
MDLIREHLIYKDVPITICMKSLKQQEQYEVVRLLLATRKNVKVCLHGMNNKYILILLNELGVQIIDCQAEKVVQSSHLADLLKE